MNVSVTIDGASGTGKSVLGVALAEKMQGTFYSTGAIYRRLALLALERGCDVADSVSQVLMNNEEDALLLKEERVGHKASELAAIAEVREQALMIQRKEITHFLERSHVVMDGRDAGSVIWPQATHKFFLTADVLVCAQRRAEELGLRVEDVLAKMKLRDKRDREREVAPLVVPDGAIVLDTTLHSKNEVLDQVYSFIYLP
ncbi:MAG: (d)CMP kinase [Alphaproteobacteria bacterium]|nr:(d)CMP kinase [Alphaproteobacteria bacterium]